MSEEFGGDEKYEEFARLTNAGVVLLKKKQYRPAIDRFAAGTGLCPRSAVAWLNLGVAQNEYAKSQGAAYAGEEAYHRALGLRFLPEAINNLAVLRMHNYGDIRGAVMMLEDAAVRFHLEDAKYNYSIALLMEATILRTEKAWDKAWMWYEHRPQTELTRGDQKTWRGEPLRGKRILVGMEQGLGDQIWALRHIRSIAENYGAIVTVAANDGMRRLMEDQPYISKVLDAGQPQPVDIDFVIMSMSLAQYVRRQPEALGRYLEVKGFGGSQAIKPRRIGICWSGSVHEDYQAWRNLPWEKMRLIVQANRDLEWFSLQKGKDANDCLDTPIVDVSHINDCKDMLDTARLIDSLDLVITVDTMIPHLAGALGTPTWLMNRRNSCWQWGAPDSEIHDPKFYSSVEQFAQLEAFKWGDVVGRICERVEKL